MTLANHGIRTEDEEADSDLGEAQLRQMENENYD